MAAFANSKLKVMNAGTGPYLQRLNNVLTSTATFTANGPLADCPRAPAPGTRSLSRRTAEVVVAAGATRPAGSIPNHSTAATTGTG